MKSYFNLEDLYLPEDIDGYAKSSYGDIDLDRITSYIEECTQNLASIEKQLAIELEIERPWPNLIRADLRLRKTTELRRIRICPQLWSPIRQLPLEILGEIFLNCLPPMTRNRLRSLCSREAPLALCQVCSSWRTTAIGNPRLWNQLEFRIPGTDGMPVPEDLIEKMKVWVGRGGDLPLSLRLTLKHMYRTTLRGNCVSLGEVLSQEPLSSLCNLDISIFALSDLYPSFKRALVFKRLESLIVSSEPENTIADQSHLTLLPGSFMLRRAVLMNVFSVQLSATLFPWGQLTHLYAGDHLSIEVWYRLMSYCVNLRVASFGIDDRLVASDKFHTSEAILLPHLSVFNILIFKKNIKYKIPFSRLVLPSLRTLRILFSGISPWSGLSDYSQLHLLQELALFDSANVSPTGEDLRDLFQATPLLSSLQLSIHFTRYAPYKLFFANLLPNASPSLLPNLEKLEIHCVFVPYVVQVPKDFLPGFADLVKARWWIPLHLQATYSSRKFVRLRQAILCFTGVMCAGNELYNVKASLQQCVDEGLILHLSDDLGGDQGAMPFSSDFIHRGVIYGDHFHFDVLPY